MTIDVLILNSGEWVLGDELAALPWHVLIYRQRGQPRNELHLWLPRRDARRSGDFACKRFWVDGAVRWCIEIPLDPDHPRYLHRVPRDHLRFTSPDGRVLWARQTSAKGLGDLSDSELGHLLSGARAGSFAAP